MWLLHQSLRIPMPMARTRPTLSTTWCIGCGVRAIFMDRHLTRLRENEGYSAQGRTQSDIRHDRIGVV